MKRGWPDLIGAAVIAAVAIGYFGISQGDMLGLAIGCAAAVGLTLIGVLALRKKA
jgi:hypothetical protein